MSDNKENAPTVSGAFITQLKTATHRANSMKNQRDGILDQLTEIQVLHALEVENRIEVQEKLGLITQQLAASQEQTLKWVGVSKDASLKVGALTWYCEQLLKQSPDSNGMNTIDIQVLNDIVKVHQSVLTGEKVSTNIADVIRVTSAVSMPTTKSLESNEEVEVVGDVYEEVEVDEEVVELSHGLASTVDNEDSVEFIGTELGTPSTLKSKHPPRNKKKS